MRFQLVIDVLAVIGAATVAVAAIGLATTGAIEVGIWVRHRRARWAAGRDVHILQRRQP